MSARSRGWLLVALAVVLLIAAGTVYVGPNRLVLTGQKTLAEVTESTDGDPPEITVRFTTRDGQRVTATTSLLAGLPPVGAGVFVRYQPSDPSQVAMENYRVSSPAATLLLIGFTVAVGTAWVTWRRARTTAR